MHNIIRCVSVLFMFIAATHASDITEANSAAIKNLKQGGHVALMRHALAPGTGDPQHFTIGDCSTQRNLNQVGRAQAAATGDYFREHNVVFGAVYSSQWCRCIETAELMNSGEVLALPVINSFFQTMHESADRTDKLINWLAEQETDKPLLLVTHQVNITALTGVTPRSGEIVIGRVLADGKFEVTSRIEPR